MSATMHSRACRRPRDWKISQNVLILDADMNPHLRKLKDLRKPSCPELVRAVTEYSENILRDRPSFRFGGAPGMTKATKLGLRPPSTLCRVDPI